MIFHLYTKKGLPVRTAPSDTKSLFRFSVFHDLIQNLIHEQVGLEIVLFCIVLDGLAVLLLEGLLRESGVLEQICQIVLIP